MLLFDWHNGPNENIARSTAILFGAGLIGGRIAAFLRAFTGAEADKLAFAWDDEGQQALACQQLLQRLEIAVRADRPLTRLSFVYSAGACGFGADWDALAAELRPLQRVVDLCTLVHENAPKIALDFHLISSAGGLFEGQSNVGPDALPNPLRPYGTAKLQSEAIARALPPGVALHIYRPSTVYGYASGGRFGLVATLIRNAVQRQTTRIFGSYNTLRDFVHVDDVAKFVAQKIVRLSRDGGDFLLASGKATCMAEIIEMVRRSVELPLYVQFEPRPDNALNNTYMPAALPENWSTRSLTEGVGGTALLWRQANL